jgi:endonuclease III
MKFKSFNVQKKRERAHIIVAELKRLFSVAQTALHYSDSLQLLVAIILSAQTTDKQVNKVTAQLFKKYAHLEDYCSASLEDFTQDIASIGLYKNKAKHIMQMVRIVKNNYDSVIPNTMKELVALPGVGRKTANVYLAAVHDYAEGIAVDTHVIRLCTKWGLTKEKTQLAIEKDLINVIPKEEWLQFTNRVIEYGRVYSPAHKVHDETDPISISLIKFTI